MKPLWAIVLLSVILIPATTLAGEQRPLCTKVTSADLVFEMRFTVRGSYRTTRGRPPAPRLLARTLRTGRVTRVFKGRLRPGTRWKKAFGVFRNSSVAWWKQLYRRKTFARIFYLKKSSSGYSTTGWAEESASCVGSRQWRNSQYSFCPGYASYVAAVARCGAARATASPAVRCSADRDCIAGLAGLDRSRCARAGKRVTKLDLNRDGRADVWKLYRSQPVAMTCKQLDLNFDGKLDMWIHYDQKGRRELEEMDLDFDGRVDLLQVLEAGKKLRHTVGPGTSCHKGRCRRGT